MPFLTRLYIVLRGFVLPLALVLLVVASIGVGLVWLNQPTEFCINPTNPESRGCSVWEKTLSTE